MILPRGTAVQAVPRSPLGAGLLAVLVSEEAHGVNIWVLRGLQLWKVARYVRQVVIAGQPKSISCCVATRNTMR
jgi:hypothetical protein